MFTLRATPAYNKDQTNVQVIDKYGNYTWADAETAKAGNALPENIAVDQKNYRMAAVGECDLVAFLKKYLCVFNSLKYTNGVWTLTDDAEKGLFSLEHIKDYFKGVTSVNSRRLLLFSLIIRLSCSMECALLMRASSIRLYVQEAS